MQKLPFFGCVVLIAVAGCTSAIPYRAGGYVLDTLCKTLYDKYDTTPSASDSEIANMNWYDQCWSRSREKHADYDLLFVEFDDQGWVQGAAEQSDSTESDHLSKLYEAITEIHKTSTDKGETLSLVLFVHGWKHSAEATDSNVHSFRNLLHQIARFENSRGTTGPRKRVVGIYVGWRGKSIDIPLLDNTTFWERKNVAERVSQGAVQELTRWLDVLRDTSRDKYGKRNVKMFTIGHSFGGLIVFESLHSELLRNIVRFKANPAKRGEYISRFGDLVLIVNPAFEGSRYEPVRAAAKRMRNIDRKQLPVMIIATSEADQATGFLFPLARVFSTSFEKMSGWWGPERRAAIEAVGHNPRYVTHTLSRCEETDDACQNVCSKPARGVSGSSTDDIAADIRREFDYMSGLAKSGFDANRQKPTRQYLCNGLDLQWTKEAYPENNPFWVVRTTKDIMKNHNDIFNPAMMGFVRQMYMGTLAAERDAIN